MSNLDFIQIGDEILPGNFAFPTKSSNQFFIEKTMDSIVPFKRHNLVGPLKTVHWINLSELKPAASDFGSLEEKVTNFQNEFTS